jgi:transposase
MCYNYTEVMIMAKHTITEQEYNEVLRLAKKNKNKRIDKRLQVIILRYEGMTYREIADKLGYAKSWVGTLCADFKRQGAVEYARHKYGGNHKALDYTKEKEILDSFRAKAEAGRQITAVDIKKAFDEERGKDTGRGYIYMVLARHGWRMVMPRGKHPKKATEAEIEASKKLTLDSEN